MCIVYHHLGTPIRWYEWARVHHPPPPGLTIFFCTPIRDSNSRCNYNPALWKKKKKFGGRKTQKNASQMWLSTDTAQRNCRVEWVCECGWVGGYRPTQMEKSGGKKMDRKRASYGCRIGPNARAALAKNYTLKKKYTHAHIKNNKWTENKLKKKK